MGMFVYCLYLFLWAYTYIPPCRLLTEGISQTGYQRNVLHVQNMLTYLEEIPFRIDIF